LLAGCVGWFEAFAAVKPFISTAPPNDGSSWSNVFFPIGDPVAVEPGDQVSLSVQLGRRFWSWEFAVKRLGLLRRCSDFNSYPPGLFKPKSKR